MATKTAAKKSGKTAPKPARRVTKKPKSIINFAAEQAAEEAVSEFEQEFEPQFDEAGEDPNEEEVEVLNANSLDVFNEGYRRALNVNDSVRFHISKDSQLISVKDWPYSWERLMKEFGPGFYRVFAKRRSNGQILKQQTEQIGDPDAGREIEEEVDQNPPASQDNLAVLGWLQQSQERAEARAREAAKGQENSLATVMQTIMTATQESNKLMMTMFMEQAKNTQTMMMSLMQNSKPAVDPLLMTVLTKFLDNKPKDDGMKLGDMMKLISDAETRAENRATKQFELIEKKADALADIKAEAMAGADGEEKPTGLIGSLAPILTAMLQAQQAGGGQPQSQQNLLPQPTTPMGQPIRRDPGIEAGFVEQRRPAQPRPAQPVQPRPVQPAVRTVPTQQPPAGASISPEVVAVPQPAAQTATAPTPEQLQAFKSRLFEFAAPDIGLAMSNREDASKTAQTVLKKLEIEGVPRQTVAKTFSIEDFYGYADQLGLTALSAEVKPWLKEFHDAIQKEISAEPVRAERISSPTSGGEHVSSANGATQPVANQRGKSATRGPGAQPRQPTKNI